MNKNKELNNLIQKFPLISKMVEPTNVLWINPKLNQNLRNDVSVTFDEVVEAEQRLQRFAPFIELAFPETKKSKGIIESDLKEIPEMRKFMEGVGGSTIPGKLVLKCDYALPISGSIKARGGIYEVLKHAEKLAIEHGLLSIDENYTKLYEEEMKHFFSKYKIAVGSTGNLGLSIGIMGSSLGFKVTVHMSQDAKEWKKNLLRSKGVKVVEYENDYSLAVEEGRKQAANDPMCHFVDDENSIDLFAGYAVSALRVKEQLQEQNIVVDEEHPLFVYLPCGVGGGPGGVAYGLKEIYGNHVHIFFGEPIQSPCMLLGMMTGLHDEISVNDIGLTNITEADGLAVGRPSKFVGKLMEEVLSGCYTVEDKFLFKSLRAMYEQEQIFMEPSAHAGVYGPIILLNEGSNYLSDNNLNHKMQNATHLIWSTGGDMVPEEQRQYYLLKEIER
ncbi:putative D-serine dehydratase [Lysinibacillus sp. PLM2]|nr:putative D-serine dehydratase [Lysinibacillus sp. PLM2]